MSKALDRLIVAKDFMSKLIQAYDQEKAAYFDEHAEIATITNDFKLRRIWRKIKIQATEIRAAADDYAEEIGVDPGDLNEEFITVPSPEKPENIMEDPMWKFWV